MLVRMKAEKAAQLEPCAGKTKLEPAQPGSPSDAGTLCPGCAGTAPGTLHPEPVPCKKSTAALSSAHHSCSQAQGQDIGPRSPFVLQAYARCGTQANCAQNQNKLYTKPSGLIPAFATLKQMLKKICKAI